MLEGSIVFLTKRKVKHVFDYRGIISYLIALFTKGKESIDEVKVHTGILFRVKENYYVREMDIKGNRALSICEYKNLYGDRLEIRENPYASSGVEQFNRSCETLKSRYDFVNLFVYQPIKAVLKLFLGEKTEDQRTYSEDTARQFSILVPKYFKNMESITPMELYRQTKHWKIKEVNG